MNINASGTDSLAVAIGDLRDAVDRWINDQKNRLLSLEDGDVEEAEDVPPVDPAPAFPTATVRFRSIATARFLPTGVIDGGNAPSASFRRPGAEDSGSVPSRPAVDPTSSRERLDALARHLKDRLRRNQDQSSDRSGMPLNP